MCFTVIPLVLNIRNVNSEELKIEYILLSGKDHAEYNHYCPTGNFKLLQYPRFLDKKLNWRYDLKKASQWDMCFRA